MSNHQANDLIFGFSISNTHLYPGCQLKQQDELPDRGTLPTPISVEFSDGTIVVAHIHQNAQDLDNENQLILTMPAYKTAAKTNINAKNWLISKKSKTDWNTVKLLAE
ncbi:hypothetical protein [Bartonella sp. HY038]|uniref:hypothetical protein n=1 Tax=Bartonella sp. HY038 TaxID=2759660 RepID=UPI0015F9B818|nr:hypothetical protein [Bartonella sp. HY038]